MGARSRSSPRGSVPSMVMTPTSSSGCCPARATGTASRTGCGSGSRGSRRATRFMRDLEIDLVPGRNVAAVDLFDTKHAQKVLAAYGRAYETLPARAGDLTKEQQAFLDRAVSGLAEDGQVVAVRLALFAEMV